MFILYMFFATGYRLL